MERSKGDGKMVKCGWWGEEWWRGSKNVEKWMRMER
jgi:hypothetical protein